MKGRDQVGNNTNGVRALPGLARSITLAQIEASICYWRRQGRRHYEIGPAPGEQHVIALEQLYARLLATRQGAVRAAQLTVYEYDALLGGLPARLSG